MTPAPTLRSPFCSLGYHFRPFNSDSCSIAHSLTSCTFLLSKTTIFAVLCRGESIDATVLKGRFRIKAVFHFHGMSSTAIATPTQATTAVPEFQTWMWQGHTIRYVATGTGTPLVLLHGFGASILHWRKNIRVLANAGYRVYAIDLLGFGGSDKPAIEYSMELWRNLVDAFWDEFINEPTVFVGNSIGALLSLMLVTHQPERAAGAVLLNCAGGLNHRPSELFLPLRVVMGAFEKAVNSQTIGPWLFDRVRQKHRIRGTLKQVYGNRAAVTDELIDAIYEPASDPGAQKVFAAILRAHPGPTPEELLPQATCPLLVLWGETDPWTPIQRGRQYETLSDLVEFVALPQTGHCPHDERPELVNPLILQWLSQHKARETH